MKDYDYLSLVVEISPQTQRCPEDVNDYDHVCELYENNDNKAIYEFMMQWEYFEDTSDTQKELDKFESIILQTGRHILAVCESSDFGWQGDAFFLYRKEKRQ